MAFNPQAAATYLASKPVELPEARQMSSNWTQALGIIPSLNMKVESDLANTALAGKVRQNMFEDELNYYRDRDALARKGDIFGAIMAAGGKFAGDRVTRAAQLGLKLPSLTSTTADLTRMMTVADSYGARSRNLVADGTRASSAGTAAAIKGLGNL